MRQRWKFVIHELPSYAVGGRTHRAPAGYVFLISLAVQEPNSIYQRNPTTGELEYHPRCRLSSTLVRYPPTKKDRDLAERWGRRMAEHHRVVAHIRSDPSRQMRAVLPRTGRGWPKKKIGAKVPDFLPPDV